jgi:glycerol-3-phosphate acyltransferase PlsY
MTIMVVFLLLTYLAASIPFGLAITSLYGGDTDIRAAGSGNIGATNVARIYGWRLAIPVLVLDMAKGAIPVLIGTWMWPDSGTLWLLLLAAAPFMGHCFSIFLEFRGGKGVATGAGVLLTLAPLPLLGAVVVWAGLLAFFGRSSMASLISALILLIFSAWLELDALPAVLLLCAGIAYTHATNIQRLVRGEEKQIVRPVRWGRPVESRAKGADVLNESISGRGPGQALWKEDVSDPLSDSDTQTPQIFVTEVNSD